MYVAKRYLTKYIYVCLGSKIPWTRMYIAKYLTKMNVCLGSKIPHEKKRASKKRKRRKKKIEKKEKKNFDACQCHLTNMKNIPCCLPKKKSLYS